MSVFAEKHYPESVFGKELDEYLARGWYRMGQSIFTTHFLCFGDQLYSAIWVRLPLQDFSYRKGQRKLLRRNGAQFTIEYGPIDITAEKEELYQRYKRHFKGHIARTLAESLLDDEDYNTFQTVETRIYDDGRLIGLSFFDVGKESAASILGLYDPDYASYSLGYYTMLLEMEYCLEHGLQYYYPGYVVPGYERFEYKLRIGEVEYLQLATDKWVPYNDTSPLRIPIQEMKGQLMSLQSALEEAGLTNHLYYYPLFEANLFGLLQASYLDFPVVLQISGPYPLPQFFYLAVFDVRDGLFKLLRCSNFDDFRFYFNEAYTSAFDQSRFLVELMIVEQILAQTPSAVELAGILQRYHEQLV
ncbi:MAG: GNAT family N-acetyltransferase [Bacteroidota bacterium]